MGGFEPSPSLLADWNEFNETLSCGWAKLLRTTSTPNSPARCLPNPLANPAVAFIISKLISSSGSVPGNLLKAFRECCDRRRRWSCGRSSSGESSVKSICVTDGAIKVLPSLLDNRGGEALCDPVLLGFLGSGSVGLVMTGESGSSVRSMTAGAAGGGGG